MLSTDNNDKKEVTSFGKTYFTDIIKTVRSTKLLFISIVVCILAVCLYCGFVFSNKSAEKLAEQFYSESNHYDLKVTCPIGFELSDADEVKGYEYVEKAELCFSTQKYINGGDKKIIAELTTAADNINIPTVVSGKLPTGEKECAIELELSNRLGLKIGDSIQILSDKSPLLFDEYQISAIVILPQAFKKDTDFSRGVTSVGNGEVSTFIIVDEAAFEENTVPNIMYITLTKDCSLFSDEYKTLLTEKKDKIAGNGSKLVAQRFEKNINEYRRDLESAQKQYADGEQEYLNYLAEFEDAESRLNQYGAGSVSESVEEELTSSREQLNDAEYQLKIASNTIKLEEKTLNLVENNKGWYVTDALSDLSFSYIAKNSSILNTIILLICCIFIAVSAIVTFTSVKRMVYEQRLIIGNQKVLGMSDFEISLKYILYIVFIEIIGIIVGVLLSYFVFEALFFNVSYSDFYYFSSFENYFSIGPVLTVGLSIVFLGVIAAILALYLSLRNNIQGSRKEQKLNGKNVAYRYIPTGVVGFFRNLLINKPAYIAMFICVCGISFIMVTVLSVYSSSTEIIDNLYGDICDYDYTIYADKNASYSERSALFSYIYNYKVTSSVCLNEKRTAVIKDGQLIYSTLLITDNKNLLPYIKTTNVSTGENIDVPESGALISESLADYYDYKVGDTIIISDSFGSGCKTVVSGIFDYNIGYLLVMSSETYENVTEEIADMSQYYVKIYKADIDDFISGLYEYSAFVEVDSTSERAENDEKNMQSVKKTVLIFFASSVALLFFVILNFSVMNINKKRMEISVMNSLGTTSKGVYLYAVSDNIAVSLLATIIGVLIGGVCSKYIIGSIRYEFYLFAGNASLSAVLMSTAVCIILIAIVCILSLPAVKKICMNRVTECDF